jgi:glycosyltransferase involved in cell wall biosynthesis
MKILHVAASYLPATRYGGTIVSVHALCRALAGRGHDVHVYTTSVDGPGDSAVPHQTAVDVDGVKVWYFPSRHLRRLYVAPALGQRLRDHVKEFDVVHTHAIYLWPLWTAARHARSANVPYVVSPRGMLEKSLIENKSALWKAALIGFIEKRTLEQAAAIHVTSRREADEVRQFGFDLPPLAEIPNGVDVDRDSAERASTEIESLIDRGPYALFLGRINWKKGLDRLLRALAEAPRTRLIIAGNDEEGYRSQLDLIAAASQVSDRVSFAGPVSGADKRVLLHRADMLVLPSYSENFGNVVLEAMAAGRPVVVTPEVGVAEMVGTSGAGVVAEGEREPLAAAMASLTADARRRDEMGERGRALAVKEFTWSVVAARMEALYQSVVARRSRAC